jgi:hypothetical protein
MRGLDSGFRRNDENLCSLWLSLVQYLNSFLEALVCDSVEL